MENSGFKSRFLFSLIFQFYLMYRLISQKPAHFLSVQMALVSTFFQMFIVLGMYNFGTTSLCHLTCKFPTVLRTVHNGAKCFCRRIIILNSLSFSTCLTNIHIPLKQKVNKYHWKVNL